MSSDPLIHVGIDPGVSATVGVVHATGVDPLARPDALEDAVADALALRSGGGSPGDEAMRAAVRDMLRNGRYKPTGRGKPASEYLLRAIGEGAFPRINAPVDVCNVVSAASLVPISVWDVDRAGSDRYLVRHGRAGEAYVFNGAGQEIDLEDLLLGARLHAVGEPGEPIVNPVKDCMATKTDEGSTRVAALLYAPAEGFDDRLRAAVERFARLLATCGGNVRIRTAILRSSESAEV